MVEPKCVFSLSETPFKVGVFSVDRVNKKVSFCVCDLNNISVIDYSIEHYFSEEANCDSDSEKKFPSSMELKGLLLFPEESNAGPCSEPEESSPHFQTLFILILMLICALIYQIMPSHHVFYQRVSMPFPALACMLHVLPIPSLIIFGDENEL
jgi:hypothetical protein